MTEMSKIDTKALLADVTEFLWQEADILDRKDYDAWIDLWLEEGLYILPIGDGEDYENQLNLCHDNDKMRRMRVDRFKRGFSISSAPAADTVRTVSRIVIESAEGDIIKVRAAEHLIENKFGRQRMWAANLYYTLQKTEDGFKLDRKIAKILNSDGMLNSFSYLF
ncbi:Anthranilate 1,2-dioxygenase small subunit [Thalassovita gelatinovora]|uniref:Anthranilate 1,2-dioxygenase small subunit n=1 Tax=Thalassovita gelatinovora TaxID=53501 RepID=A0A0P1FAU9_THAGE|nr:aromatic-ring-hydroxylating dioxygenase subunit beta [Thalassovita gelatinovora]QIZ80716.1 aromatic-ring-hydroxylating dioxygenase subunit beta [Thalassovita gelatinovora]CUH65318.1 Anthranilate 1,2-dioxygenase small subunit [Thalassovita gelatinovora]SEQ89294.1 3-phenylpropionate/cinnamic acid dioxygenase, small subunit [Thalassovita gelatinovora]